MRSQKVNLCKEAYVLGHHYLMAINSSKHDLVVFISVMHWLLFFTEGAPFINCVKDSVMVILAGLLTPRK